MTRYVRTYKQKLKECVKYYYRVVFSFHFVSKPTTSDMFNVFDMHMVIICCLWMVTMENIMLQVAKVSQIELL